MTKKDYIKLAKAMEVARPKSYLSYLNEKLEWRRNQYSSVKQWRHGCMVLADSLGADNSKFNRDTFLKACGL